eukprot:13275350-Heterocapsa_arctica.AAC.1
MTAGMAPRGTGNSTASAQSSGPQEKMALPAPVEPSRAPRASLRLLAAVRGVLPPMVTVNVDTFDSPLEAMFLSRP